MYLTMYLPDGPDLTYLTQPYYSMSNIPALQYKTYIYKVPIYIVYVYVTLLFATLLNKRHRTTDTGPRRTHNHRHLMAAGIALAQQEARTSRQERRCWGFNAPCRGVLLKPVCLVSRGDGGGGDDYST